MNPIFVNKYIGFGYDIFGTYAHEKSVKSCSILNQEKVQNYLEVSTLSYDMIESIYGSSLKEYSKKLSLKVGLDKECFYFNRYILENFGNSDLEDGTFFSSFMETKVNSRISLKLKYSNQFKEILSVEFVRDINFKSPSFIFEKYGTHFITSAYLGSRVDFISESQLGREYGPKEILTSLNEKFKEVRENKRLKNEYCEILQNTDTKSKIYMDCEEDSLEQGDLNLKNSYKINKLIEGKKQENKLCNFDKDSLLPVWCLVNSREKAEELEKNYLKLIWNLD